jgi:hypothetical protein
MTISTLLIYSCLVTTTHGFTSPTSTHTTTIHRHDPLVSTKNNAHDIIDKPIDSLLLGVVVVTAPLSSDGGISHAYTPAVPSCTIAMQYDIPTITTQIQMTSQTFTSIATTEIPSTNIDTGIDSTFSIFGQWFFLLYVVVSLLAGGKEVVGRIMKWMDRE